MKGGFVKTLVILKGPFHEVWARFRPTASGLAYQSPITLLQNWNPTVKK